MFNWLLLVRANEPLPLFRRMLFGLAFCFQFRRYALLLFFRARAPCFLRNALGLGLFSSFTGSLFGTPLGLCNFQRQPARFCFRALASLLFLCRFVCLFFRPQARFFSALLSFCNFARESICLFGSNPSLPFLLRLRSRWR